MDFKKRLNTSVAMRTTFLVLLMIAIILMVFAFWQSHQVRTVVVSEVQRQASRSMDNAIGTISDRLSDVETALETTAGYADVFAKDEQSCYQLIERLITHNNDIAAVTLLYRNEFFPKQGRYYAPTVYRDYESKKIFTDEIGGPEHDFCYLETDSNWIYTNKLRRGYWCLPYLDSMSTKRPMVTYSVPLYEPDSTIYAVLCADVDLNWVKGIMDEAKPYPYSRVSVVSRDQRYICHPDSSCILNVNALEYAQQKGGRKSLELVRRMLRWERGSDTMKINFLASPTLEGASDDGNEADWATGTVVIYYAPVDHVMWSVSFTIPESKIFETPNKLKNNMLLTFLFTLLVAAVLLYVIIHRELRPLKDLADSTREMAKGRFDVPLPVISRSDEIGHLRQSFSDMQISLAHYVSELQQTTAQKASMESELKVASSIQMSMLPKIFPPYPERDDLEILGQLTPAKGVGGDIYDFYIRDEKLFFCIGDVSGKGVPAALVMVVTRALFRTISAHEASPERVLAQMNETLSEQNESNMFVTLFMGVLDLPTGRLRCCNAGHDIPLLVGNQVAFMQVDSNIPLGVMEWKYTAQEMLIQPQTTVFLYTDGVTEAEDATHGQFGEQRMLEVARQSLADGQYRPEALLVRMQEAVSLFVDGAEQSDDLTMLGIQYTKEQRAVRLQREITLPNDVQTVPQLAAFVDGVCEELGFDMSTTMQMNLALEEAVVNVMNYAYPAGTRGDIHIEAQANDVRLKFTITDSGTPFDPTAKEDIDTTLSAEDRPIGGLGIFLVREMMDSINYERVDGQNVLTLRKKLGS
ncbi:MAG: SpoIIE family protein phosphatase [Bacteroidaceae bacterium]|nr:SpoIIE family protein phosphatase [Bacteroidaceae bacterium]